jgi:uracil-DNA glycosylase family 4
MDERSLRELGLLEVSRWYGRGGAAGPDEGTANVGAVAAASHAALTADWETLRSLVAKCGACGLCKQRKQAVFGVGAEAGPWLFVGEGPGADEDEQGEPFVGQAGKLLDNMLAALGCRRGKDTYIANVVKCRPPGNRTPTAEEAAACAPFLDRQIELIAPKLIVALGKSAVVRLLETDASVASLRGKVHRYRGIPVVVTYHPAYLLRSLPEKSKAWEDLVFARRTLSAALAA